MRILIVSESVSTKMGGEAANPLYYLRLFLARGVDASVLCHARTRGELKKALSPDEFTRFRFIEDTKIQRFISRLSMPFPVRIRGLIFDQLVHAITMRQARRAAIDIIKEKQIEAVLEPAPITPKGVSYMYDLGAPVVIGPMCGGLEFPPAFRFMDSKLTGLTLRIGRFFSAIVNWMVPGKTRAAALLVANKCTAKALPPGCKGKVYTVIESGVDLNIWSRKEKPYPSHDAGQPVRFVFLGRFIDWKGVQYLLEAFVLGAPKCNAVLELVGDGGLRKSLEARVDELKLRDRVNFRGWMNREQSSQFLTECDVFVLPSLRECGGTSLLEAMSLGMPSIVVNWAGPSIYLDEASGIKVEPSSVDGFVQGLADAIVKLAGDENLRRQMGEAALRRVREDFLDWDSKADRVLEILRAVANGTTPSEVPASPVTSSCDQM